MKKKRIRPKNPCACGTMKVPTSNQCMRCYQKERHAVRSLKTRCVCGDKKSPKAKGCNKCAGMVKGAKNRLGERNPNWKGRRAGRAAYHGWVRRHKPKPSVCEKCKTVPPKDLANISQQYKRDLSDYEWLCRRCHMLDDGRMYNLANFAHLKKYAKIKKARIPKHWRQR